MSVLQLHNSRYTRYEKLMSFLDGIQLDLRDVQLVHQAYKIHRAMLIHDYSEFLLHAGEFQPTIRTK